MDNDEEAGLRAFAVDVGAAAAPPRPLWIECAGTRVSVASIDAEWREEERVGFRLYLTDGTAWLLYYVPELDLWSGVADAGAVGGVAEVSSAGSDHPQTGHL